MVFIKLSPDIVRHNQQLEYIYDNQGVFTNGVSYIYAYISPYDSHIPSTKNVSICIKFEARITSVSIQTFNEFRIQLTGLLGEEKVLLIDKMAGILPDNQDGSLMNKFVISLFSKMFNEDFNNTSQVFNGNNFTNSEWMCNDVLHMIRELKPQILHFSGTLYMEGPPDIPQRMMALIPVATVEFNDGYMVPFSGYAGPIVLDATPTRESVQILLETGQLLSCLY